MNILIFKTANESRMKLLMEGLDRKSNHIYLVLPEKDKRNYERKYENIRCIATGRDYIEYKTIMSEKRIPDIRYEQIWVPSSFKDNYYSFGEVYAVISELKYDTMVWVSGDGEKRTEKYSAIHKVKEMIWERLVRIIFAFAKVNYVIDTNIKGIRW